MKFLLILCPLLVFGNESREAVRHIHNFLAVKDYQSAVEYARAECLIDDSPALLKAAAEAYAKAGEEDDMILAYSEFQKKSDNLDDKRFLQEEMAWGIIKNGRKSASPLIRLLSAAAAMQTNDSRGVEILLDSLKDNNALIRLASIQFSTKMQDQVLKNGILELLQTEKDWEVRTEALRALGAMKVYSAKPYLLRLLSDSRSETEEVEAAIDAVIAMTETVTENEIQVLSRSNKKFFRILACKLITAFNLNEQASICFTLAQDESPEVRQEALISLAVLRCPFEEKWALGYLEQRDFDVNVAALYLLLLSGSEKGDAFLETHLYNDSVDNQRKLSGLILASGQYGVRFAKKHSDHPDFFVRMNFARALINTPDRSFSALNALFEGVMNNSDLWMKEEDVFSYLSKSEINHHPLIPNYPEFVNNEVRLEILNILAIKNYPRANEAVKKYLKERGWGISGLSSALLLTEGDEDSVVIVRSLLDDPDPAISLQAALILTLWDKDEKVGEIFKKHYPNLTKDKKEVILEAFGRIGDEESLAFLEREMGSPHQSLRIISAASMLKCLYD